MTVQDLLSLEPGLKQIADTAANDMKGTHNPWLVYTWAKSAASGLVGCGAREKALRSGMAYDCFIDYLAGRMGL